MDRKLMKAIKHGSKMDWLALASAVLDTDIIRSYLHHSQNLDFRTQQITRVKQYTTELGSVMVDFWVNHEHAKISKIDTTYFEILLSMELDHIRMSTKKNEWSNDATYKRCGFEIEPKLVMDAFHKYKLELT